MLGENVYISCDPALVATLLRGSWPSDLGLSHGGKCRRIYTADYQASGLEAPGFPLWEVCVHSLYLGPRESPDLCRMRPPVLCARHGIRCFELVKGAAAWNKTVRLFVSLGEKGKAGLQSMYMTGCLVRVDPLGCLGMIHL